MRVVINEFISLDGVVQAPGGVDEDTEGGFRHGGWSMPYFDPEVMGAAIGEGTSRTTAILQGRRTWLVMAAAWPERAGDPMADWFNTVDKYVVSSTLTPADAASWAPTTIIRPGDLVATVSALREQGDGELNVMGSASVVRALLDADLVDELLLMIEPVILGGGKRVFADNGRRLDFELVSSVTAKTGVLVCRYRRAR